MSNKRVLFIASNYGLWAEELQAPWDAVKGAGHDAVLATYQGVAPLPHVVSVDPDFVDPIQNYRMNPPEVVRRVEEILKSGEWDRPMRISDATMDDFDAIAVVGGPGAPLDITGNPMVHKLLLQAFRGRKPIGALCYAVAALVFTRDPDNGNRSIIFSKRVTAHPHEWDFGFDLSYPLQHAHPGNPGTDVVTPGFVFPLQYMVEDAVGPAGEVIADPAANRERVCVAWDPPFLTGLSVESARAFGDVLVEVLRNPARAPFSSSPIARPGSDANVAVVKRLNDLVNTRNWAAMDELFASDYVDHNASWSIRSVEDLKLLLADAHRRFAIRNELVDVIACGDRVVARVLSRGRHQADAFGIPPTGKETVLESIEIYRFAGGRIQERWVVSDALDLLRQIGAPLPGERPGAVADVATAVETRNMGLCAGILQAINEHDYGAALDVLAPDFKDHHPGLGDRVSSRDEYVDALRFVHRTLDMRARVDHAVARGDWVYTRVTLTGRHVGTFMGIDATNNAVEWTTLEMYRIANGKIQERWALDDTPGLLGQLGFKLPGE